MDKLSNEVWVFIEQRNGKPADVSFELLSKGLKLAQNMGGMLKAIVIGDKVEAIAKETFKYGVDETIVIDHPELKNYRTMPYSRIMNNLVNASNPRIILFGASIIGRDLAPRVASNTKSGLTADCTDLKIDSIKYLGKEYKDLLLQIRPAFGGNIIATIITPDNPTQIATVREGVMEKNFAEKSKPVKIREVPFVPEPVDEVVKILEQHREESKIKS